MEGAYRNYPLTLNPWIPPQAPDQRRTEKGKWLRLDVPLSNPNNKYIRLSKGVQQLEWHTMFVHPDLVQVKHGYGDDVSLESSDMVFSSYVMTEAVTARMGILIKETNQVVVAMQGDALFALVPNTLADAKAWKPIAEAMTLLTDIKDALNN